jgi:L-lactate dehydrogenase (cytochrome)
VSALVLTLDLPISGQRHKDIKNGLSAPPKLTLPNLVNIAGKPRWWWNMLQTRRRTLGNIVGHIDGMGDNALLSEWCARQFDPTLNWDDVRWIRSLWDGKLVLKGIQDARTPASPPTGADALIVSNHGGRQLDGAPSSIVALPRSPRPSAIAWKCTWTAASARARTC